MILSSHTVIRLIRFTNRKISCVPFLAIGANLTSPRGAPIQIGYFKDINTAFVNGLGWPEA